MKNIFLLSNRTEPYIKRKKKLFNQTDNKRNENFKLIDSSKPDIKDVNNSNDELKYIVKMLNISK